MLLALWLTSNPFLTPASSDRPRFAAAKPHAKCCAADGPPAEYVLFISAGCGLHACCPERGE